MKKQYTKINNLSVSNDLLDFVNNELLKDTKILPESFWSGFDKAVHELTPKQIQYPKPNTSGYTVVKFACDYVK